MTDFVVTVRGFSKRYGSAIAVDRPDFDLGRGEIFALLGPNGAGKTSTLECIEWLRRSDGGSVSVFGLDPAKDSRRLMRRVGVQLQAQGLPGSMTVREALGFFARYRGIAPSYDAAERLGLGDRLHAIMAELRAAGTTILLADRALVLVAGRAAARGSPRELTAQGEGRTRIVVSTLRGALRRQLPELPAAERLPAEDDYLAYRSEKPATTLAALLAWLEAAGDEILDLRVEHPSLEERFLEIVKRRAA